MSYEDKKLREIAWQESNLIDNWDLSGYTFPKEQAAKMVESHMKGKVGKVLIAPCGRGDDFKFFWHLANEIYGIDLSSAAMAWCPSVMNLKMADILDSGYADSSFDLVVSTLFFHHLLKVGFEPFLNEYMRVLKKGGGLIILEPSLWYPLNIITRPMKRILGNPFGELEDEDPFPPHRMLALLKRVGFVNIEMQAATYSHCAFPKSLARLVNKATSPLLRVSPFKYFGWLVAYWAEKQG